MGRQAAVDLYYHFSLSPGATTDDLIDFIDQVEFQTEADASVVSQKRQEPIEKGRGVEVPIRLVFDLGRDTSLREAKDGVLNPFDTEHSVVPFQYCGLDGYEIVDETYGSDSPDDYLEEPRTDGLGIVTDVDVETFDCPNCGHQFQYGPEDEPIKMACPECGFAGDVDRVAAADYGDDDDET
jgi:predicted RNA-binding Zn-ribbon protein involved in translation (DUF1610 family)